MKRARVRLAPFEFTVLSQHVWVEKMAAPMLAASRLHSIPLRFAAYLFLSLCVRSVKSAVVYDPQTLADIGVSVA